MAGAVMRAGGTTAGLLLAGPSQPGKACLRNVPLPGGFGIMTIQGGICSASLDAFTDALAAAGIRPGGDAAAQMPGAVPGLAGDHR